jgi:hypothetical protein
LVCDACTKDKQYVIKLGNDKERQTTKPLDSVHLCVCGPVKYMSIGRARYIVTFVDVCFKNVRLYMIKSKEKWFERLKEL